MTHYDETILARHWGIIGKYQVSSQNRRTRIIDMAMSIKKGDIHEDQRDDVQNNSIYQT